MAEYFLIANPKAGSGKLARRWGDMILPFLQTKLKKFDFAFTTGPGSATSFAREAMQKGYTTIVAMGGDGTLNEVVNGFFANGKIINPKTSLGLIPFGSGGDFARTAGIPRDYRKAVDVLLNAKTRPIDIGQVTFSDTKIESRYFINIANAGVVADVMLKVNPLPRALPALSRYLCGTVLGFLSHKNIPVKISFDGDKAREIELTALVVGNGRFFGRGMQPLPNAILDDGFFDIVVLKNTRLAKFLKILPRLYRGDIPENSDMHETHRSKVVSVKRLKKSDPLWVETDGENHGSGDVSFTVLAGAIPFKMPQMVTLTGDEIFAFPKIKSAALSVG